MSLVQIKNEFFRKGTDNQTRPDIIIDLKRKDKKQIGNWSEYERYHCLKWIEEQEKVFNAFIQEMKCLLK